MQHPSIDQSSVSLAYVICSSFDALKTFFSCTMRNTARTESYYQNNQPFWETSLSHINEKTHISSGSLLCPITSKCKASIVLTVSSRDMGGLCLPPGPIYKISSGTFCKHCAKPAIVSPKIECTVVCGGP